MIRALAIAMSLLLAGCASFPDYEVEPEILRDRVTVVWHRTTPEQMARLSKVFLPEDAPFTLGGMTLPGPQDG